MINDIIINESISVWLTPYGVSFCQEGNELERYDSADVSELVRYVRKTVERRAWDYHEIRLVVDTDLYTLIPSDVFDPEQSKRYFERVVGEAAHVCQLHLAQIDSVVLYAVPMSFYFLFSGGGVLPALAMHLERALALELDRSGRTLVLFPRREVSTWMLLSHGEFEVCHSKLMVSDVDMVYYTLATWQSFEYDQRSDVLYIVDGEPERVDALVKGVETFIDRIDIEA